MASFYYTGNMKSNKITCVFLFICFFYYYFHVDSQIKNQTLLERHAGLRPWTSIICIYTETNGEDENEL